MEQFGEYLKAQREKKGIRLEEIASITKIHLHSLELLEESRWEQLPPEPFLRGFIIAYAKYIGLDPKEILAKYLEAMAPQGGVGAEAAGAASMVPASAPRETTRQINTESPSELIQNASTPPTRRIFATVFGLVVLAVVAGFIFVGRRSLLRQIPSAQLVSDTAKGQSVGSAAADRTTSAVVPSPVVPAPVLKDKEALAVEKGGPKPPVAKAGAGVEAVAKKTKAAGTEDEQELIVEVKHKSWAKVVMDDKAPVETILQEGEKATYTAKNKIKLVLGNASGATVTHNGEPTTGVKYDGTIRFYVFPTGARFTQDSRHVPRKAAASSDDDDSEN